MYFRDLDDNNMVISRPIKNRHGKKHIIGINIENPDDKLYFDSISEAAKEMKTDRTSLGLCIQGNQKYSIVKNYIWREIDSYGNIIEVSPTIEEKIKEYNEKNPVINGIRHNIKEWCNIYGISTDCFYNRKKKGMGVIEALTTPKRR